VRIGLVMAHSLAFYRDILRGVKTFAVDRPGWVLTPIASQPRALTLAKRLGCDGYIAHAFDKRLANVLVSFDRPVVNVAAGLPDLPFPRVMVDHFEVGRQAARHLLDRGLRQFGFVGYPRHEFSIERERGFCEVIREAGASVAIFHERPNRAEEPTGLWLWNRPLLQWLTALPQPVGVLASHDTQAAQVSEYCHQLGRRVPDDVAIVGVDDDDLLCELSRPPLSSVALPGERIGYEAARLLDKLLAGHTPDREAIVLPPPGVVVRQSSNLFAVDDPHVRTAIRFIGENGHRPLRVADVLKIIPVARRVLERRFRNSLRRSISEEIRRVHIERSRQLLVDTELSMAQIAGCAGFHDSRHFSIVFRRETGMSPTQFRSSFRPRG